MIPDETSAASAPDDEVPTWIPGWVTNRAAYLAGWAEGRKVAAKLGPLPLAIAEEVNDILDAHRAEVAERAARKDRAG